MQSASIVYGELTGVGDLPVMLWHRYAIDGDGTIADARIVPDLAEPGAIEGQPARGRRSPRGARRRRAPAPLRAGRAQPRPVHLVRHALLRLEIDRG